MKTRQSLFLLNTLIMLSVVIAGSLPCPALDFEMLSEGKEGFEDFVPPITSAFVFEDPLVCTELRPSFLWQNFPGTQGPGLPGGGHVWLVGNPTRIGLGKYVGITNWKYGYANLNPQDMPHAEGWGDLGLGIKFALIRDEENRFLLTPGINYEFSQGSPGVSQGNGEGLWMPYIAVGKGLGNFHLLGCVSCSIPMDQSAESTSLYYGLHLDYMIKEKYYPMIELNGQHILDDGDIVPMTPGGPLPLNYEGGDMINFGFNGTEGNDIVTLAGGLYYRIMKNVTIGLAYERPITKRQDLMEDRFTFQLSIKL